MRLILLGPPGCGKGTQAKLLAARHGLEHISTGDLIRAAIRNRTPLGLRVKAVVEAGGLAPDEVVNDLIRERFGRPDRPKCFLMDGYPRTRGQADVFDAILQEADLPLSAVVLIDVPDEEIVMRITGRLTCPNKSCGSVYHRKTNTPKVPGVCDVCGSKLIQRPDDNEHTVRARLENYRRETVELIPYYRGRGLLREVQGQGRVEEVYQRIVEALGAQAGSTC